MAAKSPVPATQPVAEQGGHQTDLDPGASGSPGNDAAGEVMYTLIHAAHAVEKRLDEALELVQLSGPKFGALSVLVQAGEPMSLSELATRLTCVRSNITQLVDRLEADGLVRRVDDPADRRGKRAAVTQLGQQRQAAGAQQVLMVREEMARVLSALDRDALASALAALR